MYKRNDKTYLKKHAKKKKKQSYNLKIKDIIIKIKDDLKVTENYNDLFTLLKEIDKKLLESIINNLVNKENLEYIKYVLEAYKFFILEDFKQTEVFLNKSLDLGKEFSIRYSDLGVLYHKQKEYEKGITYFEKALSLEPNNINYLIFLGDCYSNVKRYVDARDTYTKLANLNPKETLYYGVIANIYLSEGNYVDAIRYLEIGISKRPNEGVFYTSLGVVYFTTLNYEKAIDNLKKAISISKGNYINYSVLGTIYNRQEKYQESILFHKKAIHYSAENYYHSYEQLRALLKSLTSYLDLLNEDTLKNKDEISSIKGKLSKILSNEDLNIKSNMTLDIDDKEKLIYDKLANDFFKGHDWMDIKFFTVIDILSLIININNIDFNKKIARHLDNKNLKEITRDLNNKNLKNDGSLNKVLKNIGNIIEEDDEYDIKIINIKLLLLEHIKSDIENLKNKTNNTKNKDIQAIFNIFYIYINITKKLQSEFKKLFEKYEKSKAEAIAREKEILQRNIMQAMSHTLSKLISVERQITDNIKDTNLKEEKIRLQLFQVISSSILSSIKVAFGGNIENNITFFKKNSNSRISLFSILYFTLNMNLNDLLLAAGDWEIRYMDFFNLNNDISKVDEMIEITENIMKNDDFKILKLSDENIETFSNFFKSNKVSIINNSFDLRVELLSNFYVENTRDNNYTFSVIFIIFQELILNMFKYGAINDNNKLIVKAEEEEGFLLISFENLIKNKKEKNKLGTLTGVEMIKMFSGVLGRFEHQVDDNKFIVKVRVRKKYINKG